MKIPFDIKYRPQIESGEYKVEIGKYKPYPARIVCWDFNGKDIIVIGKHDGGKEIGHIYTVNGKLRATCQREDNDLFVVTPEPELAELEFALRNAFADTAVLVDSQMVDDEISEIADNQARRYSAELLDIARTALVDEQTKREDLSFSLGLRQGREETKKSPWIPASNPPDHDMTILLCNNIGGTPTCVGAGHYLLNGMWVDSDDKLTYPDYWMEIPKLSKEELTMATKRIVRGVDAEVKYYQLSPLLSEELHWDRFRMLASAMGMAGFIAREDKPLYPGVKEINCSRAIEWADELIKQLKEE